MPLDANTLLRELMVVLPPELPLPEIQIVNQPGTPWLARDVWRVGGHNTTIFLQKVITGDERTLRRVLAHELCHHAVFLLEALPGKAYGSGHGRSFHAWADRFNTQFGKDFVTDTSDQDFVQVEDGRTYLVLLKKNSSGALLWSWAVRPSSTQRETIQKTLESAEAKLVQTPDRDFTLGARIGKGFSSTWDQGLKDRLQVLWDNGKTVKVATVDFEVDDGPGTSPYVRITLQPKLGFHYDLRLTRDARGNYEGEMFRMDAAHGGPPYKVSGSTIGALTQSCWAVLDEGYRIKTDEAEREGDRTRRTQLVMEWRLFRQNLMADLERKFRVTPPGPRRDWSRPWEHALKEGSMARIRTTLTRQELLDRFRVAFPSWRVELSGGELIAMASINRDWQEVQGDLVKLRGLTQDLAILTTAQTRQGRTIITVDVHDLH